jgi:tetratricopeptide (TPR) repeat protein
MSPVADFPLLTRSRRVSPEALRILQSINAWGDRRTKSISQTLTQLQENELWSLPDIAEQALGGAHPELAKLLHRLAVLYHSRENPEKAESLYLRALASAESAFTEPQAELGVLLNNFGRLRYDQRKYAEAETLYRHSLAILREVYGLEHAKLATPLTNLATLYLERGELEPAGDMLESAIVILETAHGPENRRVVKAKKMLASVKERERRVKELIGDTPETAA